MCRSTSLCTYQHECSLSACLHVYRVHMHLFTLYVWVYVCGCVMYLSMYVCAYVRMYVGMRRFVVVQLDPCGPSLHAFTAGNK